jgi:hypothetical protein
MPRVDGDDEDFGGEGDQECADHGGGQSFTLV